MLQRTKKHKFVQEVLGTLQSDELMAVKTRCLKVNLRSYSLNRDQNLHPPTPAPQFEFLGSLPKFRKRDKIWSLLVYALHKM